MGCGVEVSANSLQQQEQYTDQQPQEDQKLKIVDQQLVHKSYLSVCEDVTRVVPLSILQIRDGDKQFWTIVYKQFFQNGLSYLRFQTQSEIQYKRISLNFKPLTPISFKSNEKNLIVVHESGSVILQQLLSQTPLNLNINMIVQHAHHENCFYYQGFQRKNKIVGEEPLVMLLNDEISSFDRITAIGPIWFLKTIRQLTKYYQRPAQGLYLLLDKPSPNAKDIDLLTDWFDLNKIDPMCIDQNATECSYSDSGLHKGIIQNLQQMTATPDVVASQRLDLRQSLSKTVDFKAVQKPPRPEPVVEKNHEVPFPKKPASPQTADQRGKLQSAVKAGQEVQFKPMINSPTNDEPVDSGPAMALSNLRLESGKAEKKNASMWAPNQKLAAQQKDGASYHQVDNDRTERSKSQTRNKMEPTHSKNSSRKNSGKKVQISSFLKVDDKAKIKKAEVDKFDQQLKEFQKLIKQTEPVKNSPDLLDAQGENSQDDSKLVVLDLSSIYNEEKEEDKDAPGVDV